MKSVEQFVSPLVENLFPSFYRDEGQDFVAFIKAYYEWLEQHFQWARVDNASGLSVGDNITQIQNKNVTSTGNIYSIDGNELLIFVTSFAPFRCRVRCNVLAPIINQNGHETYISEQTNVNPLYHGRNLFKYRDIDNTIDLFILQFKEKYLKNIQFNIATNKQLLVKNALSLYRAKGTERAIDLFFRLVYNNDADVYYPGDDIFKVSDGDWYVPRYLEVTHTLRSIDFVGKTITGMSSGATAFVEKFIKRKADTGYTHVFYINNISGTFQKGETLKTSRTFPDAPRVLGSLSALKVTSGGSNYNVGDIVNLKNNYGSGARGRVTSTETKSGEVEFVFLNGGYGYSSAPTEFLSEKTLNITNINASDQYFMPFEKVTQSLANITFSAATTNNFIIGSNVYSYHANGSIRGSGRVIEASAPSIVEVTVDTSANNTTLLIITSGDTTEMSPGNIIKGSSNLSVVNTAIEAQIDSIVNSSAIIVNTDIIVANGTAAVAVSSDGFVGEMFLNILSGTFPNTSTIYTAANADYAIINAVFNKTVSGTIVRSANLLDLRVENATEAFSTGSRVYQNNGITDIAEGTIYGAAISGGAGIIQVSDYVGVFDTQYELAIRGNAIETANVLSISTQISVQIDRTQQVTASINATANSTTLITLSSGDTGSLNVGDSIIMSSNQNVVNTSLSSTVKGIINATAFYVQSNVIVSNGTSTLTIYDNTDSNNYIVKDAYCNTSITNTSFTISSTSLGSNADYSVSNVDLFETVTINTDFILPYAAIPLSAGAFSLPKNTSANLSSFIMSALTYGKLQIGNITDVITANPGRGYTLPPDVAIRENTVASLGLRDYVLNIQSEPGTIQTGEVLVQFTGSSNTAILSLNTVPAFTIGEIVYDGANLASATASGIVDSVNTSANSVTLINVTGTFINGNTVNSYATAAAAGVISMPITNNVTTVARGIVTEVASVDGSNSTILVRRLSVPSFVESGNVVNDISGGHTANIFSIAIQTNSALIGTNANVAANTVISEGSISTIEIADSGFGYPNGSIVTITGNNINQIDGAAMAYVDSYGTGAGYYRNSKGFLSSDKYLHDGDFYQEYSYQVLTRMSFDKYSDIFKKVMHVSGTKVFGDVVIQDASSVIMTASETSIVEE